MLRPPVAASGRGRIGHQPTTHKEGSSMSTKRLSGKRIIVTAIALMVAVALAAPA